MLEAFEPTEAKALELAEALRKDDVEVRLAFLGVGQM